MTAYNYAAGDPVNQSDPSGYAYQFNFDYSVCKVVCVGLRLGADTEGNIGAGPSIGAGGGGGGGFSVNDGELQGGVSATASCNIGPAQYNRDLITGENSGSVGGSAGAGCSAQASYLATTNIS